MFFWNNRCVDAFEPEHAQGCDVHHRRIARTEATTLLSALADQDGKLRLRPIDVSEVCVTHQRAILL